MGSVRLLAEETGDRCAVTATVASFESTSRGLVIHATAPIDPQIVEMHSIHESGFAQLSTITIDIPGAALDATAARASWSNGLFAEIRATRYRRNETCGVRVRLMPRAPGTWIVEPGPNGSTITSREIIAAAQRPPGAERDANMAALAEGAGAARVGGNYTTYQLEGARGVNAYQLQGAFAERIPELGTVRGFASAISPRSEDGSPWWGVGLSGFRAGKMTADFAAGDLFIPIGASAWSSSILLNSLMIRGAGTSVLLPDHVTLQVFGGRTARSTLIRVATDGIRPGLSNDHIMGGQGTWDPRRWLSIGGGWMYSDFEAGATQHNVFEMFELRRGYDRTVRLLTEQSRTDFTGQESQTGYAVTVEPRISTQRFSLTGAARYLSVNFHPPAGADFFSTLRRSYDLSGGYRPSSRVSLDVVAGQAKTFSLFDPESIGTLSRSSGVTASAGLTNNVSAFVSYSQTDLKSDPGALVPADSRTSRPGAGISLNYRASTTYLRAFREDVSNHIDPNLDLHSTRLELDQSFTLRGGTDLYDRGMYGISERADGARVNGMYQALLGFRNMRLRTIHLSAQAGVSATPAGVQQVGTRETFASLGIASSSRVAQNTIQFTYQRLEVGNQAPRNAWNVSFNGGRLFEWGSRAPVPPYENRAMRLVDTIPAEQTLSPLRVIAIDENGAPVAGIRFVVDDAPFTTNEAGEAGLPVPGGVHRVTLLPEGALLDYFSDTKRTFTALPPDPVVVTFTLRAGGRVSGRVTFQGELTDRSVLQDIRIVARSNGVEREVLTDENGEFRFGLLPLGSYTVSIDRATLAAEMAVEGAEQRDVTIISKDKQEVTFTIRKATARERFGAPVSRGSHS